MLDALKVHLPLGLNIAYPGSGDIINEVTGTITDAWSAAPPANTVGTGSGAYSGPSGIVIEWRTATVLDGRRPVGKLFVVPCSTTVYQTDGTIVDSTVAAFKAAADTFVGATAGQFFIWHRPIRDPNPPHSITRVGGLAVVNSTSVPDTAAVMRSRRQ